MKKGIGIHNICSKESLKAFKKNDKNDKHTKYNKCNITFINFIRFIYNKKPISYKNIPSLLNDSP